MRGTGWTEHGSGYGCGAASRRLGLKNWLIPLSLGHPCLLSWPALLGLCALSPTVGHEGVQSCGPSGWALGDSGPVCPHDGSGGFGPLCPRDGSEVSGPECPPQWALGVSGSLCLHNGSGGSGPLYPHNDSEGLGPLCPSQWFWGTLVLCVPHNGSGGSGPVCPHKGSLTCMSPTVGFGALWSLLCCWE